MDNNIVFLICLCGSALFAAAAVIWAVVRWKKRSEKKHMMTSLRILTLGVFISCIFICFPFHRLGDIDLSNPYSFIGSVFFSIHSTLQAFVLESNLDAWLIILKKLDNTYAILQTIYTFWLIFLFIVAPILTLTNILSLFNALLSELRIKINFRKSLYVFSEMNDQSIAIARSIAKRAKDGLLDRKPMFVFTDCYPKDAEPDQDLLQAGRNMRAVCIKTDITHLKLSKKRYPIEFFIIGADDSENMEHAIKLNDTYRDSSKCSVYVYSAKPNAGYILDSVDKGNLTITSRSFTKENAKDFLDNKESANKAYGVNDSYYYIRRVNVVDAFTVKALTENNLMHQLSQNATDNHEISILIVGLGLYGTALLKNALWLYQIKDCRLKIHVIESEEKEKLLDRIAKEMPGLTGYLVDDHSESSDDKAKEVPCLHYHADKAGDCQFDICVYPSIDCETSDLEKLLLQKSACKPSDDADNEAKRPYHFSDVQAVFVTLGEDNKNIEAAVDLRGLFDRIKHIKNRDLKNLSADESPLIYSIVYDNRTAKNLDCGSDDEAGQDDGNNKGILCYNGAPYHIRFIGRMSEHYHYDTIRDMKTQEFNAISLHVEWIQNESDLRKCFRTKAEDAPNENAKPKLDAFKKEIQGDFDSFYGGKELWNDVGFYYTNDEIDAYFADENDNKLSYDNERIRVEEVEKTVRSYDKFEYFRDSSVAKETYCKKIRDGAFSDYFRATFNDSDHIGEYPLTKICSCEKCIAYRESEHMRWNAYMIAKGYRYDRIRNDRSKTHPNMKPWQELPVSDRYKD